MSPPSESEILQTGAPATAIIKGLPSPVEGHPFLLQILLDVQPTGARPYEVNYVFPLARMDAGLVLGMQLPVIVDAQDPRAIAVQWDVATG